MDIKPKPRTQWGYWNRWSNDWISKLVSSQGRKIKIDKL